METLTIHTGSGTPLTAKGKHQCNSLDFAFRYPGWHSYAENSATERALSGLERRGSVIINRETRQFRVNMG